MRSHLSGNPIPINKYLLHTMDSNSRHFQNLLSQSDIFWYLLAAVDGIRSTKYLTLFATYLL